MTDQNSAVSLTTFYGVKSGMTRIFDGEGKHVPVTVIKLIPNFIGQVKTKEVDGYNAYQLAFREKREKLINNPTKGHLKKAGISTFPSRFVEVRLEEEAQKENLGKQVSLEQFPVSTYVDVTGISKGKGFQGVVKRHHMAGGPATHGSHFHRRTGSIGNRATPARVFPEKRMPGHMGDERVTTQNLQVIHVNENEGYMLIKGSVPGAKNGIVKISKSIKKG